MYPIAAFINTVLLFMMKGGFSEIPPTTEEFKARITIYMIVKLVLVLVCALVTFLLMDDTKILKDSLILHEESRKLGLFTQLKLLLTDKIYVLFVFGSIISISFLGATDNHLESLLAAFTISIVTTSLQKFLKKLTQF
jgi:hypothetical protein